MRIGSLCSGYGGLDMAVESVLGGSVAWFCEYDRDPSRILAHHWPDVPNHGDVKATEWAAVEPVDVLTAGYPCQPFSHAGNRKGADDPRHLWPDVARAVGALRPRLVVLENVAGHVSLGLADVLGDLSALGYDATWGVVRASDAGAAHGRARLFIVAAPDADSGGRHGWRSVDAGGEGHRPGRVGRTAGAGTDAAPDTGRGPQPRPATARDRLRVTPEHGHRAHADTDRDGHGTRPDRQRVGRVDRLHENSSCERQRARPQPRDRGATAAPDADRNGLARVAGAPIGRDAVHGHVGDDVDGRSPGVEWGAYGPAINRWSAVVGRAAPVPTEPGRTGQRLSPRFVEWLMGLPAGHVTDVPGLTRNAQLKALGNGVVPQQAALALRLLLPLAERAA